MSGMKSKLGLFTMMAAMAAMGDAGYSERSEYRELTDEEKAELKDIAEKKRLERLKHKGVNEYFYGQNVIYARNQKNADRKARNKGYLQPLLYVSEAKNRFNGIQHKAKRRFDGFQRLL